MLLETTQRNPPWSSSATCRNMKKFFSKVEDKQDKPDKPRGDNKRKASEKAEASKRPKKGK